MSESKRLSHHVFEPRGTRVALVGLSSLHVMTFNGFRRLGQERAFAAFRTVDEALAHLAGDGVVRPRRGAPAAGAGTS